LVQPQPKEEKADAYNLGLLLPGLWGGKGPLRGCWLRAKPTTKIMLISMNKAGKMLKIVSRETMGYLS
jgi:hypothetical protein